MALVVAMVTSFHGFLSGMASLKMVPVLRFRNLEVDEILEGPFTNAHELKEIYVYMYIYIFLNLYIYIHLLYTYTQLDAQKSMSILKRWTERPHPKFRKEDIATWPPPLNQCPKVDTWVG